MTLPTIVNALEVLALQLANDPMLGDPPPESGLTEAEWAYVRGLAGGAVLMMRDRLLRTARPEESP